MVHATHARGGRGRDALHERATHTSPDPSHAGSGSRSCPVSQANNAPLVSRLGPSNFRKLGSLPGKLLCVALLDLEVVSVTWGQ